MKVYVIASSEYRLNMPDMFVMDNDGNYFGVLPDSYAKFYDFPKSVEFWRSAECSDAGRRFIIDEVDVDADKVSRFDDLTKSYVSIAEGMPEFEEYPMPGDFSTKKEYVSACSDWDIRHRAWMDEKNISAFISRRDEVFNERTNVFCSLSERVYDGIKDNSNIGIR